MKTAETPSCGEHPVKFRQTEGTGPLACLLRAMVLPGLLISVSPRPGGMLLAAEVPPGFVVERLATNLNAATAIAPAPDGRIFIADQTGPLLVWKDGRLLERPALNLDGRLDTYWERGLIGIALSPEFPREPYLFALYVAKAPFTHHVLSRFTLEGDAIDPASEKILLEGDDQAKLGGSVPAGHQGGALRFGLDGRLYISLGEQTAGEPAQKLDTLQGKILRLNRDGSIPEDNPFFNRTTGKYRAIFALGVRNSFGLAAQPHGDGGRMFFTDVGGSAFEEINELRSGANYGWPRAEGFSTNAAFVNPIHAYPPLVGQSIVGGVFLPQTSNWPEKWRGKFLFADFMKHWIKAIDPAVPTNVLTFARGFNGPVATELAPDGSLLVLNRGAVWRDPKKFVANAGSLVRIRHAGGDVARGAPVSDPARAGFTVALGLPAGARELPPKLMRADWERRLRAATLHPLTATSVAWHPFVSERQRLALPAGGKLRIADGRIDYPPGSVLIREFEVLRPSGYVQIDRFPEIIETRLTVLGQSDGYGASYRWTSRSEAELIEDGELAEAGLAEALAAAQGAPAKGRVNWWFPGLEGHLTQPGLNPSYSVPATVAELNGLRGRKPYGASALENLIRAGLVEPTFSNPQLAALPRSAFWNDPEAEPGARVRSYLHANCAVCHQPGGASRGNLDLRLHTPLAQTGLINGGPLAGDLGIPGAKIVVPGDPAKSILLRRVKDTGFFRMPPTQFHAEASPILPVMEDWIRSLAAR